MSPEIAPGAGPTMPPPGPPSFFAAPPPPPPPPPPLNRRRFSPRHPRIAIAVLSALVAGGAVGGFLIAQAATATSLASDTTSPTSSPSPSGGPMHGRGGFGGLAGVNLLDDAASYLGISEQTLQSDLQGGKSLSQVAGAISGKSSSGLISALVSDETTAINSAQSNGKISSAQASKLESKLTQRITNLVEQTWHKPAAGPSLGFPGSGEGAAIAAAAKAIGVTAAELQSDLAGGQSIAAVAGAHNVSVSTVESAVTAAMDSRISSLESGGKLTSSQASQLKSEVTTRVESWVTDTYPGWPFGPFGGAGGRFGGAFGPGGPWGHPPGAKPAASPSPSSSASAS